jgi:hypothetical protein
MLQSGTNIMANQVKTPIQNYFEKVLYENLTFDIPPLWFFKSSRWIKKKLLQVPVASVGLSPWAWNLHQYSYWHVTCTCNPDPKNNRPIKSHVGIRPRTDMSTIWKVVLQTAVGFSIQKC